LVDLLPDLSLVRQEIWGQIGELGWWLLGPLN
jgi:hypothetical protein